MRRLRTFNILFLVIGLGGLVFLIVHTGPARIGEGIRRVGIAFPLVCAAHLVAIACDSVMLWACASRRPRLRSTFRASLAGHGINEATPLAKLGEVTKFTLLAESLPTNVAAGALILQNITMFVAACLTIAGGSLVTVLAFPVGGNLSRLLTASAIAFGLIALVGLALFRFGVGGLPFRIAARLGVGDERLKRWQTRWNGVESHWRQATRNRGDMAINWTFAALSRCAELAQAAIILKALGSDHVLAAAVMSVASFQLILWATSFIPMQMGSHEAGSYALFAAVGLAPAAGLLLELVRKLRRVVFVGIGVVILAVAAFRKTRLSAGDQEAGDGD